jgi:hypothetical protein
LPEDRRTTERKSNGRGGIMSDTRVCIVCGADLTDVMGVYVFVVDDATIRSVPELMCVNDGANMGNNLSPSRYAELTQGNNS